MDIAQRADITLNVTCGGEGVCRCCIIRVMAGQLSSPNLTEEAELRSRTAVGLALYHGLDIQLPFTTIEETRLLMGTIGNLTCAGYLAHPPGIER